ncbi:MAG: hypothetical protein ACI9XO_004721 [Paraglaciecola sp.]|jgi:hypothetical protein
MQNTIVLSLFLCFATTLEAQNPMPKKKTSLGIDLIFAVLTLSDNTDTYTSSLEIIYKEHVNNSAMRFRASVTSFSNEKSQFLGFKADSTFIRSYYQPSARYGIAIGGEYKVTASKNPMYAGLDIGFNYEKGYVEINRCLKNDCEFVREMEANHTSLEFTPFLGWEFNLNERFFLNVELGPYFLINFGDRPYADENEDIQLLSLSGTELNVGRILRDISVNYRF